MKNIDQIDSEILKILTEKGRESHKKISEKLGYNKKIVKDRIRKLEEKGIIKGYTAKINPEKTSYKITAFLKINTESSETKRAAKHLKKFNRVCEIHETVGDPELFIKIRDKNRKSISKFVEEKVSSFKEISEVKITMSIETYKEKLMDM